MAPGDGEDDELSGRPGHRDVAIHRVLDARAEVLRVDEGDEVELKARTTEDDAVPASAATSLTLRCTSSAPCSRTTRGTRASVSRSSGRWARMWAASPPPDAE